MGRKKAVILEDYPKPSPKEKFLKSVEEIETCHQQAVPKFEAANTNQKLALAMLKEGRNVVFLTGSAGVGKSMIAAYHAACQLKSKKVDKVFLVRPAVSVGKSIGLIPGDISDKLHPYFAQTLAHLEKFMGSGFLNYCLEKNTVELKPAEYLRGMSFEHCIVVAEECQNFTTEDFEMLLTRLGKGCTLILTGDEKQNDLKGNSGLAKTIEQIKNVIATCPHYMLDEDLEALNDLVGIVHFTPEDVVRSGLTRSFVKLYYNA